MTSIQDKEMRMESLLNFLRSMREHNTCDCVIICEQQTLPAHRIVLSASSPYLNSILNKKNQANFVNKIDLSTNVPSEVMADILDYMYSGTISNISRNRNHLQEVVVAAHFLKMQGLFQTSLTLLSEELGATDIQQLLQLWQRYESDGVMPKIISHVRNKICHLTLRDDFLNLTVTEIRKLCQYLTLNQDDVFKRAIDAWTNVDDSKWVVHHELRSLIRDNVTKSDFSNHNSKSSLACGSQDTGFKAHSGQTYLPYVDHEDTIPFQHHTILFFSNIEGKTNIKTYDIEGNHWSEWQEFLFHLNENVISVVHGSHIYFMGGYVSKVELSVSSMLYDYCMQMNVLVSTDTLCLPVISGSAAVLNDKIYLVGVRGGSERARSSRRVLCYDITKRLCQEVAQTNEKYLKCIMYCFKNFVYIADKSMRCAGKLERYEPTADQWTVIASQSIAWFNVSFSGSLMLVMSAYADSFLNVYDIAKDVWLPEVEFDDGPNGVFGFWPGKKCNRPIIVVQSRDNLLYIYDITMEKWERIVKTTSLSQDYVTYAVTTCVRPYADEEAEDHHPMLYSLNDLRHHSVLTDVTLICAQQEISAHAFVLSASLPYFRSMFTMGFLESKSKTVNLPGVSAEIMEIILTFLYTGKICKDTLEHFCITVQVLEVAHMMEIRELYDICLLQLTKFVNLDNFVDLYRIAELYDSQELASYVSTQLGKNFFQLMYSSDFLMLSANQLKQIIQHPELKIPSDIAILENRLSEWCCHDRENRENLLTELIPSFDLDTISEKQNGLRNTVKSMMSCIVRSQGSLTLNDIFTCTITWSEDDLGNTQVPISQITLFNPSAKKISEAKTIPFLLVTGMAAVGYGSYIFFIGGGEEKSESSTRIYQYCPFNNVLVSEHRLSLPVTSGGACSLGDIIYIVSGNIVQRYIPVLSSCNPVSKTQHQYVTPVVFSSNSHVFVFSRDSARYNNALEQYNPLTDQWTTLTNIPSYGSLNYVCVPDNTLNMIVTKRFERFLDYRKRGVSRRSSQLTEKLAYNFENDQWTATRKLRPPSMAETLEDSVVNHNGNQILYTDLMKCQFSYPIVVRDFSKYLRKTNITRQWK